MATTYEPIQTTTLGTAVTTVTLSSIPATYTDIICIVASPSGTEFGPGLRFGNGGTVDSGSNYSNTSLLGNGTSATSSRTSSVTYINPYTINNSSNNIIQILNYSNTTTYKTCLIRANTAASTVWANVGLWRSTAAIDTLYFYGGANSFAIGTTFTLYGIKAA